MREQVAWTIELKGHVFDLEDLANITVDAAVKVVKQEGRFDLVMPMAVGVAADDDFRKRAEAFLEQLNGIGALLCDGFERVSLGELTYRIDANGERMGVVISCAPGKYRIRGGRAAILLNGVPLPDERIAIVAGTFGSAQAGPAITDVLTLLGRANPKWAELYVVYEIIEANADGVKLASWVSKRELTRFKRTAGSYEVLGIEARHGNQSQEPPDKPMTYAEAVELIRAMAKGWLSEKRKPTP